MPNIKYGSKIHEGIENISVPLADGSGDAVFRYGSEITLKNRLFNEIVELHIDEACVIPMHFLNGCSNLTKFSAPNATNCGDYAFYGCTNTLYFDFGNITALRILMLNGLHKINTIILRNTTLVTLNGTFNNNSSIAKEDYTVGGVHYYCYFYVPRALIEDYKIATNWSTYSNRLRPLEDYTVDGTVTGAFDESKL